MEDLAARFEAELWRTVEDARSLGYNPSDFALMLRQHGGVRTAKRLVLSGDLQTGFERLAKLGRLDISMERKMLTPEFASLFTAEELGAARWRLDQVQDARGGRPS